MRKHIILFFLLLTSEYSFATLTCAEKFQSISQRSPVEIQLSTKLQPYFDQIPQKASEKILRKLKTKIENRNISEIDFYNLSQYFYKSLQGSFFKSYVSQFISKKVSHNIEITEEFHNKLHEIIINDLNVDLKSNMWIKTRLRLIESQLPLSWLKSIALNAAVQWGVYSATGNFLPLPVSIPRFAAFNFEVKLSGFEKASIFYEELLRSLINTYYALSLTHTILGNENGDSFINLFRGNKNDILSTEGNNYESLRIKSEALSNEVDAFLKKYDGELE